MVWCITPIILYVIVCAIPVQTSDFAVISDGMAAALRPSGLATLKVITLANGRQLIASSGSVISFRGDAVVNAANTGCVTGGGVDGAINRAGGPELLRAREALGGCPTGEAKLTGSYNLSTVKHIIHAVGPDYSVTGVGAVGDAQLTSAYTSAARVAAEHGITSFAYSLISAGVYRGRNTLDHVLELGARALVNFLTEAPATCTLREVHMVAFQDAEQAALLRVFEAIDRATSKLA